MSQIKISDLTATTSVDEELCYVPVDDGTSTKKITLKNLEASATASAQSYATAAAGSATSAQDYATAAATSAGTATTQATAAAQSALNASGSATSASGYADTAQAAASTASSSATSAATSANSASQQVSNAAAKATLAESWAVGDTGTRAGEDANNSKYFATQAGTSATNAASSASNAATSASNASTSETNAGNSATSASSSASSASTNALKAEGYAVGKQSGVDVASDSPYYQANAKYYKEQAASSATTATTKAGEASTSASNASTSATSAAAKATLSESWAVGGTNTRSGEDVNNAKYWAEVAAGAAGGGVTSFNGRSGIVTAQAHDYDAEKVDYDSSTSVKGAIDGIKNNLGTAAAKDVPVSGNASTTQVVMGDDSRLTDARTPVSHTHTKSEITDFPSLGTAAAKDSTNAVTQSSTDLVESGAVYSEVSTLRQTLETAIDNKQGQTLTTAQTIGGTSRTTVEAALGALADSEYLVDNLTSSSAVKALTANQGLQLANKHKVTRKTVDTSSWTADTSSQSGTTLYKKSISLSHVYVDSPSVDISTSSGTGLPTTAQQTAYDLLQYVTVDGTTMYLYASDIPTDTFYIQIEGVD